MCWQGLGELSQKSMSRAWVVDVILHYAGGDVDFQLFQSYLYIELKI